MEAEKIYSTIKTKKKLITKNIATDYVDFPWEVLYTLRSRWGRGGGEAGGGKGEGTGFGMLNQKRLFLKK